MPEDTDTETLVPIQFKSTAEDRDNLDVIRICLAFQWKRKATRADAFRHAVREQAALMQKASEKKSKRIPG